VTFTTSPEKTTDMHTCEPSGGSIFLPILRAPSVPPVNFQNLPPVKKIGPISHVEFPICTKITNLDLPMNISAKFGPNLFSSFREEDENMKFTYGIFENLLVRNYSANGIVTL
jgi:hypothetical protein